MLIQFASCTRGARETLTKAADGMRKCELLSIRNFQITCTLLCVHYFMVLLMLLLLPHFNAKHPFGWQRSLGFNINLLNTCI